MTNSENDSPRCKTDAKIVETLKRFPSLTPYIRVFELVYLKFYEQSAIIVFDGNRKSSKIEPVPQNGKRVVNLFIGLRDRKEPLTVLWSVLHEYGHLLQGPGKEEIFLDSRLTYEREFDAWVKAKAIMDRFHFLKELEPDFFQYQAECLKGYHEKIKD